MHLGPTLNRSRGSESFRVQGSRAIMPCILCFQRQSVLLNPDVARYVDENGFLATEDPSKRLLADYYFIGVCTKRMLACSTLMCAGIYAYCPWFLPLGFSSAVSGSLDKCSISKFLDEVTQCFLHSGCLNPRSTYCYYQQKCSSINQAGLPTGSGHFRNQKNQ